MSTILETESTFNIQYVRPTALKKSLLFDGIGLFNALPTKINIHCY